MNNVVEMPAPKIPEWIVGPFEEYRVVIDGRMIPRLNALRLSDGRVSLMLDKRFILDLPDEGLALQVASFVANALAIGEGYAFLGSTSKEMPFAPYAGEVKI
jgi:prepilin signal peptidase PulO-like enzyme (type II secretory pathway)